MITDSKERALVFDNKYKSVWKWLDNQAKPEVSVFMLIKLAQCVSSNNDWRDTTFKVIDTVTPFRNGKVNNTEHSLKDKNKFIIFYCTARDSNAKAKYDGKNLIVKKGSKVSPHNLTLLKNGQFPHLATLITLENDDIIDANGVFTRDCKFSSPSQAGSIVTRRGAVNGRTIWKTKSNITIADIYGTSNGGQNKQS